VSDTTDWISAIGGGLGGLGVFIGLATYALDRRRDRRGKEVEELQGYRTALQDMTDIALDPEQPSAYADVTKKMNVLGRKAHLGYRFTRRKNREAIQRISDVARGWSTFIDPNEQDRRYHQLDAFLDDMGRYLSAAVDPALFKQRPPLPRLPAWAWGSDTRKKLARSE
jgi:hypothetical protein